MVRALFDCRGPSRSVPERQFVRTEPPASRWSLFSRAAPIVLPFLGGGATPRASRWRRLILFDLPSLPVFGMPSSRPQKCHPAPPMLSYVRLSVYTDAAWYIVQFIGIRKSRMASTPPIGGSWGGFCIKQTSAVGRRELASPLLRTIISWSQTAYVCIITPKQGISC